MNTDYQNKFFRLKQYQFIGGIISIIVGFILVLFDVNDVARISIGASGIQVGISAISGVAVIIAGIFLFFRSGGGIKAKNKIKKKDGLQIEETKISIDASKNYSDSKIFTTIACPECQNEIQKKDTYLYCVCSSCHKEWKQRMPT